MNYPIDLGGQEDPPSLAMWAQFDATNADAQERQEEAYKQIEEYNRALLNQVAGLEDVEFRLIAEITKDGEENDLRDTPPVIKGRPYMSILYLQPDRRQELMEQGEDPESGNPYAIRGEVPERTTKLLDELIIGIEATKDEARSTAELTVWRGNIGGQPIELDFHTQDIKIHRGSDIQTIPSLHVYAVNPDRMDENHKIN